MLVVLLVSVIGQTTGLDLLTASPGRECPKDRPCATRASCPYWVDRQTKYGKGEDANYPVDARAEICNQQDRGLCCPSQEDVGSPTFIPRAGKCGQNPVKPPQFIFGGTETNPGDYPFSALLGYTNYRLSPYIVNGRRANESYSVWVCSGVLINQWYVLTAAHCLKSKSKKIRHLRLGEWKVVSGPYRSEGVTGLPEPQDFQVTDSNFILYQEGRTRRYETDIALIRLPSRAELNRGTQLACLPLPGEAQQVGLPSWSGPEVGRSATVVGWGYSCYVQQTREFCKESDEVATKTQQHLEVPILDNSDCRQRLRYNVSMNQVCAGGEVGKSACNGDSGGGLFIRREGDKEAPLYLFGIVSFGIQNCETGKPEVYVRVSEYIQWITDKMQENN